MDTEVKPVANGMDLYFRAERKTVALSVEVRIAGIGNGCGSVCNSWKVLFPVPAVVGMVW